MAFTNFPDGVTSLGIPLIGSGVSIPGPTSGGGTGQVLFVNSGASGGGSDPSDSIGTITKALAKCTDGAGDTIYVFPGSYAENITVTKSGVSIISAILSGYERPDIVPAAGTALTNTTGQGFYCRGLRFTSADSDVVVQNANGFVYTDCVFDGAAGMASTELLLRLVPSATDDSYSASEGQIVGNLFRGSNGSGIGFQHALAAGGGEGTSDNVIVGNRFVGNAVSDIKSFVNTNGGGAGIYIRTLITQNQFMTVGATYKYINLAAGAAGDLTANSGLISGNFFADEALTGGAGNQIDLAGQANVIFTGNYDAAGIVNGTTFNN